MNTAKLLDGHALYYFTTCPYCIKVRLALWRLGLKLPMKDIVAEPRHKEDLIAGGGKKQVPCLRIEEPTGAVRWLYESSDIIQYVKQKLAGQ